MILTKTYAEELEVAARDTWMPVTTTRLQRNAFGAGFNKGAAWDRAWVIAWLRSQADVIEAFAITKPDRSYSTLRILAADLEALSE